MVYDPFTRQYQCFHCTSSEHETYECPKVFQYITYPRNFPNAIICDMDGTLALITDRSPYDASRCGQDKVNEPIKHIVNKYFLDHIVIICSGREEKFRQQTVEWLSKHSIHHDILLMRKTGDNRNDAIVKQEIFEADIKDKYKVRFCLDDRNRVVNKWRELGLTCLQVAEGNF